MKVFSTISRRNTMMKLRMLNKHKRTRKKKEKQLLMNFKKESKLFKENMKKQEKSKSKNSDKTKRKNLPIQPQALT